MDVLSIRRDRVRLRLLARVTQPRLVLDTHAECSTSIGPRLQMVSDYCATRSTASPRGAIVVSSADPVSGTPPVR